MPYVIQNVIKTDGPALSLVRQEIETVLKAGHTSKEGELCIQAIFTLLDMLKAFVTDLKDQVARDEASGAMLYWLLFSMELQLNTVVYYINSSILLRASFCVPT